MSSLDEMFIPDPLYVRRIVDAADRPIGKIDYHASVRSHRDSSVNWRASIFSGLAQIHAAEGVEGLAAQIVQQVETSDGAGTPDLRPVLFFAEAEKRQVHYYLYLTLTLSSGVVGLTQGDMGALLGDTARGIFRSFPDRLLALMPCIASLTPN